jgi:hypothetical protein
MRRPAHAAPCSAPASAWLAAAHRSCHCQSQPWGNGYPSTPGANCEPLGHASTTRLCVLIACLLPSNACGLSAVGHAAWTPLAVAGASWSSSPSRRLHDAAQDHRRRLVPVRLRLLAPARNLEAAMALATGTIVVACPGEVAGGPLRGLSRWIQPVDSTERLRRAACSPSRGTWCSWLMAGSSSPAQVP